MYVTPEYYKDTYKGTLSEENTQKELHNAERDIDHMCYGRIKGKGFENLTSYQQVLIQDAVCLQADYRAQYGIYLNSPLKGYTAGSTSVEMADVRCGDVATTQEIINLLEDTGLRCLVL